MQVTRFNDICHLGTWQLPLTSHKVCFLCHSFLIFIYLLDCPKSQLPHTGFFLVVAFGMLVAVCGIYSCSVWDLVPWPGIEPGLWALEAQCFHHFHWTIREVPLCHFQSSKEQGLKTQPHMVTPWCQVKCSALTFPRLISQHPVSYGYYLRFPGKETGQRG